MKTLLYDHEDLVSV